MKRLRHPIRAITEPFGKAGLTVAILALVLATTGAAFAVTGLNTKQKKEVEKIAKKFQGTGPAGPQGAAGANGKDGANGANGKDGTNGTNGKNVVVAGNASAGECPSGGKLYEIEGSGVKNKVCNGAQGAEGEPWTAGGTLPSNATETGAWSNAAYIPPESQLPLPTAISFPIPLAAPLAYSENSSASKVHLINANGQEVEETGGVPTGFGSSPFCHGSVASPQADPGQMCVYVGFVSIGALPSGVLFNSVIHKPGSGGAGSEIAGTGTVGALVVFFLKNASTTTPEVVEVNGTWAVTAP